MDDRPMTFTEHLAELRSRLVRSVAVVAVAFGVAWSFHEELFSALARPVLAGLRAHGIFALQALQVTETITIHMQIALIASLAVAAPFVLYQIWGFVAPGLFENERRRVLPIVSLTLVFFLLGVVFCYFVFLPMLVDFLVAFTLQGGEVQVVPTVERTFSITITFLLVFGLVFELPLLMFFLSLLGIASWRAYLRFGRYFVVLAFIVGAVFTPPDPLSQLLMAVPLCVLYFVGVAFGWVASAVRGPDGLKPLAGWVVAGLTIVFGAAVGTASWAWSSNVSLPSAVDVVSPDAVWALRAAPNAPLSRDLLARAGAPAVLLGTGDGATLPDVVLGAGRPGGVAWARAGGEPACEAGHEAGGMCHLGDLPDPAAAASGLAIDRIDASSGTAVLLAADACLSRLVPEGLSAGRALFAECVPTPSGLVVVRIRVEGPAPVPDALAAWLLSATTAASPGRVPAGLEDTALGEAIAWIAADATVDVRADGIEVVATTTPGRAVRSVGGLSARMGERCTTAR